MHAGVRASWSAVTTPRAARTGRAAGAEAMAALLPCMWRRAKYTIVGLQKAAHYNGASCGGAARRPHGGVPAHRPPAL